MPQLTTAVAANGVRFTDRRARAHERVEIAVSEGATCLIAITGVGELHERVGSYLMRPGLIAVRPGRYAGVVAAGPEGLRVVVIEYPPAVLRWLGGTALGLSGSRTFFGRSSVELAWRAPAEMEAGDEFTPQALDVFSQGIAVGLSRHARHNRDRQPPLAARARRRIDQNISAHLDVGALARELGCSAAYLSRLFQRTFGFSPRSYLIRRRCERARLLLTRDDAPVAGVAAALGFHDASHFARHFRRQCGTSPQRFRQMHAQVKSVPT
ncbi:MAG TPA: AraC family transcriptional regulator [Gemmatimonadaceae bacterium]|nr:AraC family transcriptional regulator [Gemmatimonadaceae bacterium]